MALPRGITIATYKTKLGVVQKYRVKVQKREFKLDKTFDSYAEAYETLLLTKPVNGKILLDKHQKEQEKIEKQAWEYIAQPTIEFYINKYIELYIDTLPKTTDLEKRRITNQKAFFTIIKRTEIEHTNIELNSLLASALKVPKQR